MEQNVETQIADRAAAHKARVRKDRWIRRLPLLPALIFTIVITQIPFVMNIWFSLTEWKITPPVPRAWTGLSNYATLFTNTFFRSAVWVTALMTVAAVVLSVLLGLGIAMLLDREFFGRSVVRTLLITPFLIMPVVAGLIWKDQIFHSLYGVLNWILTTVGFHSIAFVSKMPTWSIITVLVWQWTPFMMLIILAGLQSQPQDILEAARVDGASAWGLFRNITLPGLRPYLELGALLGSIYLIQVFDHIKVMTGGGPGSTNVPYFVYQRSIGGGWDFGQAAAYSTVVVVATIILATYGLRLLGGLLPKEEG
ncbi:MAG: sugar ABC transporter permease [Acidimicrobiia bacterium]